MNTRDLEYLIAVADHLHFGKAAEHCHVSQPTLSSQIKKFEDRIGGLCFERNCRSVRITALGVRMVSQARKLTADIERLLQMPQENTASQGAINIGVAPNILGAILPMAAQPLSLGDTEREVFLTEASRPQLYEALREGAFDVVLDTVGESSGSIGQIELYKEPFCLVVPELHPQLSSPITFEDLASLPILTLESTHAESKIADKLPLARVCAEHVHTAMHLSLATSVPALIPEYSISSLPTSLHMLPVRADGLVRRVKLCWDKTQLAVQTAEDIANHIQHCSPRLTEQPLARTA